jgi:hypothetical protein
MVLAGVHGKNWVSWSILVRLQMRLWLPWKDYGYTVVNAIASRRPGQDGQAASTSGNLDTAQGCPGSSRSVA